jgi:hypothetical protein
MSAILDSVMGITATTDSLLFENLYNLAMFTVWSNAIYFFLSLWCDSQI